MLIYQRVVIIIIIYNYKWNILIENTKKKSLTLLVLQAPIIELRLRIWPSKPRPTARPLGHAHAGFCCTDLHLQKTLNTMRNGRNVYA